MNRAGTADARATTDMGAAQAQFIAQDPGEHHIGLDVDLVAATIHGERNQDCDLLVSVRVLM
jgi:hypothetical protein